MDTAFVLMRTLHMAVSVLLLGGLLFGLFVAEPHGRDAKVGQVAESPRWIQRSALWLGLVILSGAGWLGLEGVGMSGQALQQVLVDGTIGVVLFQTQFGLTWLVRLVLCLSLAGLLLAAKRTRASPRSRLAAAATVVAAGLIASIAFAGHANSEHGAQRSVHLAADALHLLAAGAWLGALPSLIGALARAEGDLPFGPSRLAAMTRRFSALGVLSVGALVASGAVNAWFTVGTFAALWTTHYGHLLLIKLALFVAMLALAATNRFRWTARLSSEQREIMAETNARRSLQRNAIAEALLGLLVLCLVGALGVSMPARHAPLMSPSMHMP